MELEGEEKYNSYILFILRKIKYELLRNIGHSNKITYTVFLYPLPKNPNRPHPAEEQHLIKQLEKENVIERIDDDDTFQIGEGVNTKVAGIQIHLKINEKLLNELYSKIIQNDSSAESAVFGWVDKKLGEYQFGGINFRCDGVIRKKVFTAALDLYEKYKVISIQTIKEMTKLTPRRVRIELNGINKRLSGETGFYFNGTGKGYYTLEKING